MALRVIDTDIFLANGPCWSPDDRSFYHADRIAHLVTMTLKLPGSALAQCQCDRPRNASHHIRQSPAKLHSGWRKVAGRFRSKNQCPIQASA